MRFPDASFARRRWFLAGALLVVPALVALALVVLPSRSTAQSDPVIAAAGDIACDPASPGFKNGQGTAGSCRQMATSDLLVDAGLSAVFALGDLQYYCGSHEAFLESYEPSWGRVKNITHPVVGNHEYIAKGKDGDPTSVANVATGCDVSNAGGAGYYQYFGAAAGDPAKGYYSVDVGAWHIVVLNSNCSPAGGCNASSPQLTWLKEDLAAHPTACTLALWHAPRFSSGTHGNDEDAARFWDVLYASGADVVLNGHDHIYERLAPQTPAGVADPQHGIRQFTVGTGGANSTDVHQVVPNSEMRNETTFGVLKMTLHADSYEWEFVPEKGRTFTDKGAASCHGPGAVSTQHIGH